jgi:hypothetical protein
LSETRDGVRAAQGALALAVVFSVAVIALIVGLAAIAIPLLGLGYSPQQQQTTAPPPTQVAGVNQKPVPRFITMEWEATLPSLQDRWFPQSIIVNQGDTIYLTLIVNDTDGAHTFTIDAPTGPGGAEQLTQVNMTMPGQWMYHPPRQPNPWNGTMSTGPATNCDLMGQNVTCSSLQLTGGCSINGGSLGVCTGSWMLNSTQKETAEIQASVTLGPLLEPGVYRYFCTYHQDIGMVGFLTVLPNSGYVPPIATSSGEIGSALLSGGPAMTMDRVQFGLPLPQGPP